MLNKPIEKMMLMIQISKEIISIMWSLRSGDGSRTGVAGMCWGWLSETCIPL